MTTLSSVLSLATVIALTAGCASTSRPAMAPALAPQVRSEAVLAGSEATVPVPAPRVSTAFAAPQARALRHYYLLSPGPNATLVVTRAE